MGGPSKATKQQQQLTLQETQQTMAFQQQLMSMFQAQFSNQQNQLNFLKSVFQPVITNAAAGKGFTPEAEAAMRTSATDTLSGQFANAQAALNQQLRTNGDANVPSGVTAGADLALLTQEARAKAEAQNNITLASATQAKSDLFNAANVLNGVAAQNNPAYLSGDVIGGGSTVAGLSSAQSSLQRAITEASNNSFFGKLTGGLASTFGSGLGTFLMNGIFGQQQPQGG